MYSVSLAAFERVPSPPGLTRGSSARSGRRGTASQTVPPLEHALRRSVSANTRCQHAPSLGQAGASYRYSRDMSAPDASDAAPKAAQEPQPAALRPARKQVGLSRLRVASHATLGRGPPCLPTAPLACLLAGERASDGARGEARPRDLQHLVRPQEQGLGRRARPRERPAPGVRLPLPPQGRYRAHTRRRGRCGLLLPLLCTVRPEEGGGRWSLGPGGWLAGPASWHCRAVRASAAALLESPLLLLLFVASSALPPTTTLAAACATTAPTATTCTGCPPSETRRGMGGTMATTFLAGREPQRAETGARGVRQGVLGWWVGGWVGGWEGGGA